jgi:hypothetical protein
MNSNENVSLILLTYYSSVIGKPMHFIRLFFKVYADHRAVGFDLRTSIRCSWAFARRYSDIQQAEISRLTEEAIAGTAVDVTPNDTGNK